MCVLAATWHHTAESDRSLVMAWQCKHPCDPISLCCHHLLATVMSTLHGSQQEQCANKHVCARMRMPHFCICTVVRAYWLDGGNLWVSVVALSDRAATDMWPVFAHETKTRSRERRVLHVAAWQLDSCMRRFLSLAVLLCYSHLDVCLHWFTFSHEQASDFLHAHWIRSILNDPGFDLGNYLYYVGLGLYICTFFSNWGSLVQSS